MPVRAGELEVVAQLRDEVSSKLDTLGKNVDAHRDKYVAVGAAITAFSALAGREWDAIKTTIAQGTGATGADLDSLTTSFQNLAGTISGTSNEQVAGAIADVNTKFGLTGTALEDMVTKTLQAKTAFGEFDIDTFGRAMEAFGIEAGEAGGKLDLFGVVAQETGIPMGELITQAQTYGPVVHNLGLDVDETAVFFGKLHEAGVDVSRVMPGVNQAMRKAAEEGVTDLRTHLDQGITKIREAKTDTEALTTATGLFGAEGAQRMVAAIRSGVLPSLKDLDSQYENTQGRTEAVFDETVSLGDKLVDMKNKAFALVGPFGDAAAGAGSLATGAVLAGPQIATLATTIGTKLLPLLTGPVGLVALVGTAAVIAFRDLSREAEKLDKQFANVEEKQTLRTAIRDLEEDLVAAKEAAEKTERRIGTFGGVTKDVADNRVVALNHSLEQAKARLEELETASDDAGESVGPDAGLSGKTDEATSAMDRYSELLAAKAIPKQHELMVATYDLAGAWQQIQYDIENVQGEFGKLGPDDLLPVSDKAKENAERVATAMQDAATALVSTVAGDSIGGILNSLLQGDLLGAAIGAGQGLLGFLTGGGGGNKAAREAAQAERIRMWEEEAERRKQAARDVWEEEQRLAKEALENQKSDTEEFWDGILDTLQGQLERLGAGFDDALGEALEFGLFDPMEDFLQGLPDHIDVDALRTRLQGALGDLAALTGQRSQVQGLQGLVQQHRAPSALEEFVGGGALTPEAIAQYVASGGSAENLEAFAAALARLNEYLEGTAAEDRDPEVEREMRDELARTAEVLDTDIRDVLFEIHGKLEEARASIEATRTDVLSPLSAAIAQSELWKQGALTRIEGKIAALLAKDFSPTINVTVQAGGGEASGEDGGIPGAARGGLAMGGLVKVHKDEIIDFGRSGPGRVIPNHALQSGPVQLVLRDGTVIAEVVAENMADVAARRGF